MRFPIELGQLIPGDNKFSAEFIRWLQYNVKAAPKLIGGSCTPIGSSTVGAGPLHQYFIPAGLLTEPGASVVFNILGLMAANGNNKTLGINANGNSLYSSGALAANNKPYQLTATLTSLGPASQIAMVEGFLNNAVVPPTITTGLTMDATQRINIQSLSGAAASTASDILEYLASLVLVEGVTKALQ